MNKKVFNLLWVVLIILFYQSVPVSAQKFEAIPFGGYMTQSSIEAYQGSFKLTGGFDYGAAVNFKFSEGYKIELSYSRMTSELRYTLDNNSQYLSDLAVHNISIGALVEIQPRERIVPFAKVAVGRTNYQPLSDTIATEHVMHFDISGGLKILVSEHVGFRFQASLMLPVFVEGMYFEEAAPPPGQGIKTEVSGIHGIFTSGVIFRF